MTAPDRENANRPPGNDTAVGLQPGTPVSDRLIGVTKTCGHDYPDAEAIDPTLCTPIYSFQIEHLGRNDSGWQISGSPRGEEWDTGSFHWLPEVDAYHPDYGYVWGTADEAMHASSERAYQHFNSHHPTHVLDEADC